MHHPETPLSSQPDESSLKTAIRDVYDFPKPGIIFKDITPILADGALFRSAIGLFVEANRNLGIDKIVGIDARGFLFGAATAFELGVGFVPIRKTGKLPFTTRQVSYALEYGEACVEMHTDAITPGERVVLIDDLLATGGTAAAATRLISEAGGHLLGTQFLVELEFLNGRKALEPHNVTSFIRF